MAFHGEDLSNFLFLFLRRSPGACHETSSASDRCWCSRTTEDKAPSSDTEPMLAPAGEAEEDTERMFAAAGDAEDDTAPTLPAAGGAGFTLVERLEGPKARRDRLKKFDI